MFGLNDVEITTITQVLKSHAVKEAKIFGSRAIGNYKIGSDIDLAIIGNEKSVSYDLNEQSNLPYFFDVVNLEKINNKKLINHIEKVGKKLCF